MISQREQPNRMVKLFIRAGPELGCEAQKQSVLERLDALESAGRIRTYKVNVWTKEIRMDGPLQGTSYYDTIFEHYEAFQQWADEESVMLNSGFNIQSVNCEITGETYRALSLPSMCLAVYEAGDLCGVYPHSDEETIKTVTSCLDKLETGNLIRYAD